jgi:hypothetical protein
MADGYGLVALLVASKSKTAQCHIQRTGSVFIEGLSANGCVVSARGVAKHCSITKSRIKIASGVEN